MDLAVPCFITLLTTNVQGRPLGWPTSTSQRKLALIEWARQLWDGNSLSSGPIAHRQWIDLKIMKESNPVQVALPLHGGCLTSLFWL